MKTTWKISQACILITIVLAIASPGMASVSDYAAAVVADAPIAYWRFEESSVSQAAINSMGTGCNGTYTTTVSLVQGVVGQAASFNNVDACVELPKSLGDGLKDASAITVEAWICNADLPGSGFEENMIFTTFIGQKAGAALQMNGANISLGGRSDGTESFKSTLAAYNSIGEWHHIVGVLNFAADTVTVYIDGTVARSTSVSFKGSKYAYYDATNVWSPTIGATMTSSGMDRFFNGLIDEVAIYDQALSAEKVLEHYNLMPPPETTPEPATVALFAVAGLAILRRPRA
ncbi:MAG: LamG domain-containing protein [Planctomycetaceae bacterium]|nr:LamG domain-containing protein [Planctomycetaceae bacterium]